MSSYYVDLLIRNILVEQTEHHDVLVKGYVDQVVISCGSEVIARHPRSYQRDDFVFDPVHYLPLLEQKTGALDQAAPLRGWDLPEEFAALRRLLESRMGPRGKREFVQVLRLLESFRVEEVHVAVQDSLPAHAPCLRPSQGMMNTRENPLTPKRETMRASPS